MLRKEKMFKSNFKKVFAFFSPSFYVFRLYDIYADDGGYTIDDYTVNAIYHSNNTIDVKEVIMRTFQAIVMGFIVIFQKQCISIGMKSIS